jgi:hypothetical protein
LEYLDYLLKEYVDRMDFLKGGLAQGNIPTIEEYRYVCGQIRGLEAACGTIQDLKQRMENSDNE